MSTICQYILDISAAVQQLKPHVQCHKKEFAGLDFVKCRTHEFRTEQEKLGNPLKSIDKFWTLSCTFKLTTKISPLNAYFYRAESIIYQFVVKVELEYHIEAVCYLLNWIIPPSVIHCLRISREQKLKNYQSVVGVASSDLK